MRGKGRTFVLRAILLVALVIGFQPICAHAQVKTVTTDRNVAYNLNFQNYSTYGDPVENYMISVNDGFMTVLGTSADSIIVQYFDKDLNFVSSKAVPSELPIFGGFFASKSGYYFILSGQNNTNQDDGLEIYRVTKYDANWNRINSVSLTNCNTTAPFEAGSARFTESGSYLFVHTCHKMYTHTDGKRHQSNLSICVNTDEMKITYSRYSISNIRTGYCSHSFNQFAEVDGDHVITVDHGDAYPRAIVLCKYEGTLSTGDPAKGSGWGASVSNINVLNIAGTVGANTTNASVGGLKVSNGKYLVVGNSTDQSSFDKKDRNIFLAVVDKSLTSSDVKWLTNDGKNVTYGTPHLVEINKNCYAVLWSDYTSQNVRTAKVYYQLFDGDGVALGEVANISGVLSDCAPIVSGDRIIWFVSHSGEYRSGSKIMDFYTIQLPEELFHVPATGVKLDQTNVTLESGTTLQLTATVEPGDATRKEVVWESDNPNVVSVDANGKLYGISEGITSVKVVTQDGNHVARCTVKVIISDSDSEAVKEGCMFRLYNPNSGEHFYTAFLSERNTLIFYGWNAEGIAWKAPVSSDTPVYRLYNPNAGDHHYTTSAGERDYLVSIGWNDEGIGWYSDDAQGAPLYRLYNPNAIQAGAHHYTTNAAERDYLVSLGWNDEGIGWYGRN